MRAYFKNMIQAYRGKCDGLIYYYNPRLNRISVRPYVKPRPTAQTRRFAAVAANLKALAPSAGFKSDLRVYADLYNRAATHRRNPLQNWYNAYMQLMWALEKGEWRVESGEPVAIDLSTLTRAFIVEHDLPCRTVKRAVEAGLLARVNGYGLLTAEL